MIVKETDPCSPYRVYIVCWKASEHRHPGCFKSDGTAVLLIMENHGRHCLSCRESPFPAKNICRFAYAFEFGRSVWNHRKRPFQKADTPVLCVSRRVLLMDAEMLHTLSIHPWVLFETAFFCRAFTGLYDDGTVCFYLMKSSSRYLGSVHSSSLTTSSSLSIW